MAKAKFCFAAMPQRFLQLSAAGERALAASLPAWRAAQERFVKALGGEYWANFRNELEKPAQSGGGTGARRRKRRANRRRELRITRSEGKGCDSAPEKKLTLWRREEFAPLK